MYVVGESSLRGMGNVCSFEWVAMILGDGRDARHGRTILQREWEVCRESNWGILGWDMIYSVGKIIEVRGMVHFRVEGT